MSRVLLRSLLALLLVGSLAVCALPPTPVAVARSTSALAVSPALVARPATTPEQRGQAALRALRFPWRELGWTVSFAPGRRGILGEANSRRRHITIYVRRTQSDRQLRVTLAHELGHALDMTYGTTERRTRYRAVRGLPDGGRWWPCSGCADLASHAGDFAEVFALWAAGPGDFRSAVAGAPDGRTLLRLSPLFRVPRPRA